MPHIVTHANRAKSHATARARGKKQWKERRAKGRERKKKSATASKTSAASIFFCVFNRLGSRFERACSSTIRAKKRGDIPSPTRVSSSRACWQHDAFFWWRKVESGLENEQIFFFFVDSGLESLFFFPMKKKSKIKKA